jgi:hypothetical protein
MPNVRDDHDTPLWGAGTARDIDLIWVKREAKYFLKWGWTANSKNCPSGKSASASTAIKRTMHAKCLDAGGAFHSEGELIERCADSERTNAHDTNAMTLQMLQPFGIHFQKGRTAF